VGSVSVGIKKESRVNPALIGLHSPVLFDGGEAIIEKPEDSTLFGPSTLTELDSSIFTLRTVLEASSQKTGGGLAVVRIYFREVTLARPP